MFRLDEAIARAKTGGNKDVKQQLAQALWPELGYAGRTVNINNLCSGKTKRIDPKWVPIVCSLCGVSADWLFGIYG
jgi:hypothetical protein